MVRTYDDGHFHYKRKLRSNHFAVVVQQCSHSRNIMHVIVRASKLRITADHCC